VLICSVDALYYGTLIRPEIRFTVNKVCQFMAKTLDSHWVAGKCILQFLKKKVSSITFLSLKDLFNANWASDIDDRCSTSGEAIFIGPNLIS